MNPSDGGAGGPTRVPAARCRKLAGRNRRGPPARGRRWRRGAGALELAIAAPIILAFVLAIVDLGRYVIDLQRVTGTAASVADFGAQVETFTNVSDPAAVVTGQEVGVLAVTGLETSKPLDLIGQGALIVTTVSNDGKGAVVAWQRRWGRADVAATVSTSALQGITLQSGEGAVFAEVVYRFRPFLLSGGLLGFKDTWDVRALAVRRPRLSGPKIAS